jgi:transposase
MMIRKVTPTMRKEIFGEWLNGTRADVIAGNHGVGYSTVYYIIKRMKKRYHIPYGIGPKKSKAVYNRYLADLNKPKLPEQTPFTLTQLPIVIPAEEDYADCKHRLIFHRKHDYVFCQECGERWIKEN